jgi:hypothetical protein
MEKQPEFVSEKELTSIFSDYKQSGGVVGGSQSCEASS